MRIVALTAIAIMAAGSYALAYGGGGGGSGGLAGGSSGDGCGCLPPELEERGKLIEQSFSRSKLSDLRRQSWAGTLCKNHPCDNEVTEAQASKLLQNFEQRLMRDEARLAREQDRKFAEYGIYVGIGGLTLAAFALFQTHQANKIAREADRRSIQNETRLADLREENQ